MWSRHEARIACQVPRGLDKWSGLGRVSGCYCQEKKGLVVQSIYEIRAVIEDCRSQVCGGLAAGLDIWEAAVLPMLLYNADTWQDISQETTQELENIQKDFYRCLFAVGSGCPIPSLYWETGGILMKYRILMKKLLFLHHLATSPTDTLAKEILDVQHKLSLPGLSQECQPSLNQWGITKVESYSSLEWKRFVKAKIQELNREDLKEQSKPYKKINHGQSTDDQFGRMEYISKLNISEARTKFKLNTRMTPSIKMNFPSDSAFAKQFWTCPGCTDGVMDELLVGSRDTQQHVLICPGYAQLREDLDLKEDKDLVHYFTQVIKIRMDDADI